MATRQTAAKRKPASRRTGAASRSKSRSRSTSASRRRKSGGRAKRLIIGFGVLIALAVISFLVFRPVSDAVRSYSLPLQHEDIIRQQAADKDVPADLIAAVIWSESRFRDQTSSAGARGLMQLTPQTAAEIEKLSGGQTFTFNDLADPELNIRYGTYYLHYLLQRYDGNVVAALAAYNAGPANADQWGGADLKTSDIPFPETRSYVEGVIDKRADYRRVYGKELGY